ncbi:MAG: phosphate ABC transporter ATP-binding protein [Clostridia bacterium]|nr:phosphate ABC transporter ATP-binding protein [Clostridia bacterium]
MNKHNTSAEIEIKNLDLFYGKFQALKKINIIIKKNQVTSFIGPSGCGKSTCLRCINRMNDLYDCKINGEILINNKNIYAPEIDVTELRKNVGMVFQRPNLFEMSIYDNITYGPKAHGTKKRSDLDGIVEFALKSVYLWDDLSSRLKSSALSLSGGQQQRLCIARAIAVFPNILLMDEPTSALDPVSTLKIEDLIYRLKKEYTVVLVTHNMQQAARLSDVVAFFLKGELVEYDDSWTFFNNPKDKRIDAYVTGRLE